MQNGVMTRTRWLVAVGLVLLGAGSGLAEDKALPAEDDEYQPGLVAAYTVGGQTVERIDPDIAFDWKAASPDPRLEAGRFRAHWQSNLLVRQPGRYRWHAFLSGAVRVVVDGREVLNGKSAQPGKPGWVSGGEFEIAFGEKPMEVNYSRTGQTGRVMLYWSSTHFPLEPVPPQLLFLPAARGDLQRIERGQRLARAHRCNRCHVRAHDPMSAAAPDLSTVSVGTSPRSLVDQIVDPRKANASHRMPTMGVSREEAEALVGWLTSAGQKTDLLVPVKLKKPDPKKARETGLELLKSTGCLACHRVNSVGGGSAESGPELTGVGRRRSVEWLWTWLKEPARINRDHRMPVFQFNDTERMQLVMALSALGGPWHGAAVEATPEQVVRGQKLAESAGCVRCHRLPGKPGSGQPAGKRPGDLSQPPGDWAASCLAETPDRIRKRPAYGRMLSKNQVSDIREFYGSRAKRVLSPLSEYDQGRMVLEQRGCLACHERGTGKGNTALAGAVAIGELAGQSPAMVPPSLTAVGDKLVNQALRRSVAGEQKSIRLPWLRIRMPRFVHSKDELAALTHYLVAHDRVPGDPPATPSVPPRGGNDQTLLESQDLVSFKGFSCIACHQFGSFVPKNVALGTRGSDLKGLAERIRREYFLRWCREPLRIVPGMEMPSYKKPLKFVFGGDIERQLAAMWDALNDKRFQAPVNPNAVEQFLVVNHGEPPRVVRDVFTLPESVGGGSVARSLAIGFSNSHNLLLDLDRANLALWTFGDFAKQRTQGKSWFWDMAGRPVITGGERRSDLVLVHVDGAGKPVAVHRPVKDPVTAAKLISYRQTPGGAVRVVYRLRYAVLKETVEVEVSERLRPTVVKEQARETSGWDREVAVSVTKPGRDARGTLPADFEMYIGRPTARERLAGASVTAWSRKEETPRPLGKQAWGALPGQGGQQFARLVSRDTRGILLRYTTGVVPNRLSLTRAPARPHQIERVTSVPGYEGIRLPIPQAIMPTAMTWTRDGTLAFTSLKGHVYLARDTNGDGLEDKLSLFEEGLAAPYGIIADGDDLIVAHKPEVVRLRDSDGDGRADVREVLASGWGYSDDYHDWTCGIVRDRAGDLFVGLGSNYSQRNRVKETSRWRGKVLRIRPGGLVEPVGHAFRYPTGLAIDAAGRIFVSDNQGVQNTFNEINHLVPGRNYGVPSRFEEKHDSAPVKPAIHVPHPWSRSVNGLAFLPKTFGDRSVAGHGIGCEYDNRFLVRFTMQEVGGEMQGAVFHFSRPGAGVGDKNFVGPLSVAVSPRGDIYIGNIYDSGWLGGRNTGTITRLRPIPGGPNGMRDVKAVPGGFRVTFARPVNREAASKPDAYTVSGYTRAWKGGYTTADSGRHRVKITRASVSSDGRSVTLGIDGLRTGSVYEVTCGKISGAGAEMWPATGHYSLHRMPQEKP